MLIEQEIASIMHFLLDAAGNPYPYYTSIPEDFRVPAVYFPTPRLSTEGETLLTYKLKFTWYITFHHVTTEKSYAQAHKALSAIMRSRMLVPLIAEDGTAAGGYVRITSASTKPLEDGICELALTFVSRRPYDAAEAEAAHNFVLNMFPKSGMAETSP